MFYEEGVDVQKKFQFMDNQLKFKTIGFIIQREKAFRDSVTFYVGSFQVFFYLQLRVLGSSNKFLDVHWELLFPCLKSISIIPIIAPLDPINANG